MALRTHRLTLRPLPRPRQIRDHLKSFLTGTVAALAFGYYNLHQDVHRAADGVSGRIDSLGQETVGANAALAKRVAALEAEVLRLKAAAAAASSSAGS